MAKKKKAKAAPKAASKTSAKKSVTVAPKVAAPKKAAAKTSSKTSKKAAAPAATKASPKTSLKSSAKTSAKTSAPQTSTKKVAEAAVSQVANALKNVATRVTNAFSSGTDKKKVQKSKLTTSAKLTVDLTKAFAPLDDRIVVAREEADNRTAGGLYIPDTASVDKPNRGRVVVVGPGHRDKKGRLRPLDVQIGDTVVFGEWVGSEMNIEGQEYLLLRESDVLAIVNK